MMEKKSIFTIFPKLLLAMLAVSFIPTVGIKYFDYTRQQAELKAGLEQNLGQVADVLSTKVNAWIEINNRSSLQIARTEDIISMNPEQQYPLLKATDDNYEWTYAAFTTNLEGNAVTRSDGQELKFYGDREYIQQILQGQDVGQQVLISRVNGKPALCLSVPIKSSESLVGALVQCSKLTEISDAVANIKIGKTGFAFLVDSKNRLIAHGDESQVSDKLEDYSHHPAIKEITAQDGFITFDTNGHTSFAKAHEVALGWKLVVQQDFDEVFAPLRESQRLTLFILAGTAIFVIILALLLARGLAQPIRKLTTIADDYSKGKLDAKIPGTDRGDEIGSLARAIERMGVSLKISFDELTRQRG